MATNGTIESALKLIDEAKEQAESQRIEEEKAAEKAKAAELDAALDAAVAKAEEEDRAVSSVPVTATGAEVLDALGPVSVPVTAPEPKKPSNASRSKQRDFTTPAVTLGASGAVLTEAAQKLKAAEEKARGRAERFGTDYVKPVLRNVLSRGELTRVVRQKEPGFFVGVDTTSAEERAKIEARAKKFGTKIVDTKAEFAGRSEEELAKREEARKRAERFGNAYEPDRVIAQMALTAFGPESDDWTKDPEAVASAIVREDTIHVRAPGYLAVGTKDIEAFFRGFGIAYIEWLNGSSFNACFEDAAGARRAFAAAGEPIPTAKEVDPVHPVWQVCVRPMEKLRTDKWAEKGTKTIVFLRFATQHDTKDKAKKTPGARSHGTSAMRRFYGRKGGIPPPSQREQSVWGAKKKRERDLPKREREGEGEGERGAGAGAGAAGETQGDAKPVKDGAAAEGEGAAATGEGADEDGATADGRKRHQVSQGVAPVVVQTIGAPAGDDDDDDDDDDADVVPKAKAKAKTTAPAKPVVAPEPTVAADASAADVMAAIDAAIDDDI